MRPDVNANPGFWQLLILGFQHVLACYTGAVAIPMVTIGGQLAAH